MAQFLQQPIIIIAFISAVVSAALLWLIVDLRARWFRYFGSKGLPEGKMLAELLTRLKKSEERLDGIEPRIAELEKIAKISVQKVGFIRFNPFHDTGGDQSFSLALLDRENNGIIISSLYTREGTRVYAKEISGGRAKHALSDEEKKVLEEAMG
jgi:hypothetical protein